MIPVVVDASVWLDLFNEADPARRELAESFFESVRGMEPLEPALFKVELAGLLARRFSEETVESVVGSLSARARIIEDPSDLAYRVALVTGSRAADAYYIATAKLTGSILISNDRRQVDGARKAG
ncbi:MAG: type II toxin-antitoxin system VapC family toxin, partial [Candidatus Korarchaeota archaeon]|nr:type II toxin-antitoxin system VapC family toxin [Candidatus Korarchaeota archaeon]